MSSEPIDNLELDSKNTQNNKKGVSKGATYLLINKTGVIKQVNLKNVHDFDETLLYKKCGFKNDENFEIIHTWELTSKHESYHISVYAKCEGRANMENKYDLPPPVDSQLFFGTIALVNFDDEGNVSHLDEKTWNRLYEKLFGGFEDLASTCVEDEAEEDELETIPMELKTKDGYLKDGFVVDANELEYGDDNDTEDENGSISDIPSISDENTISSDEDSDSDVLDVGSELSSEEFLFSDEEA